jgi:NADH-quinone oxidoreductase subunit G
MREVLTAPAILLIGNDPTNQHPLLAWQIRTNVRLRQAKLYILNSAPIKLRKQATEFALIPVGTEAKAVAFLQGDDSALDSLISEDASREALIALREKVRGEKDLIIAFGSELRGHDIERVVSFASSLTGAKLICLADYSNSRGASEMGLYPDLLPGYLPVAKGDKFKQEWGTLPTEAGLNLPGMVDAARAEKLKALYVIGSNPVGRLALDPFVFAKSFVVVQDLFLTETAMIADVVLPAANAYEKSGTCTNTCGDLQLIKKAGEVTDCKPDFEMIVRIADAMGFDVHDLVPFGGGTHSDMGQTRGAQSGEADRHAVWLEAHNLEPKMTPFDPMAILDEIQRVVPGYGVSRANLLAGNDQHLEISESGGGLLQDSALIVPANDDLFSSGTLGRYSKTLDSVQENKLADTEVAAD